MVVVFGVLLLTGTEEILLTIEDIVEVLLQITEIEASQIPIVIDPEIPTTLDLETHTEADPEPIAEMAYLVTTIELDDLELIETEQIQTILIDLDLVVLRQLEQDQVILLGIEVVIITTDQGLAAAALVIEVAEAEVVVVLEEHPGPTEAEVVEDNLLS